MLKKIKILLVGLAVVAPLTISALPAVALNSPIVNGLCSGSNLQINTTNPGACGTDVSTNTFQTTLSDIVNIISIIVGVVAVIMIIVGGFRYITSGGSSEKVTAAKNTILYGLIGLIIVALAQIIVKFVLQKAASVG